MALAGTPVAIPETSSGYSKSAAKKRTASGIKKARSSDSPTFSKILEQSKKKKQVNSDNERTRFSRRVDIKFGKRLMGANGLGEFAGNEKELSFGIKEKIKQGNGGKFRSEQRVANMPNDASDRVGPVANEILHLVDALNPKNRKNYESNSEIRGAIDGKHRSSLTSIASKVEVQDRRIDSAKANPITRMREIRRHINRAGKDIEGELRLENRPMAVDMEIEIPTRFDGKDTRRSAAMEFARKLDTQAGNEIVRQIKIVLNSSSAGELRINLKPDNLGRIRVQIQLENNHLKGRFFVESAAAREVFKGALDGLQAKLLESGFGGADLEMAWDDASSDFWFNSANSHGRKVLREDAALEFENSIPISASIGLSDNLVNLVV